MTQKAADVSRVVIVVDTEEVAQAIGLFADRTTASLTSKEFLILGSRESFSSCAASCSVPCDLDAGLSLSCTASSRSDTKSNDQTCLA
jgi:hypothetical protein